MSTEVAKFFGDAALVPAEQAKDFAKALQTSAAAVAPAQGLTKPLLRLLKSDEWVYGQDDTPVQEGSRWAINPGGIFTGYCAWANGVLRDERMARIGSTVDPSALPNLGTYTDKDSGEEKPISWNAQIAFDLHCMNGEDEGTEVTYKTTSHGGRREATRVCNEIAIRAGIDANTLVPVVTLDSDSYKHKTYGKVYTPIMQIVGWADMEGKMAPDQIAPSEEPEPTPPPARRRRRPAA